MDFYQICTREIEKGPHKGSFELYPDFVVGRSKDLMVRGRAFYAIWDEKKSLWSTDEYDVQRLVDEDLQRYRDTLPQTHSYIIKSLRSYGSQAWKQFKSYISDLSDNSHPLDDKLVFANQEVKKTDYVSRRLDYPLLEGPVDAWDELVSTLYSPEERAKIEWAIGAIVSGDAKKIQKFLVLYGSAGTGKSTILNIIQKLFDGYTTTFDAKALGMNGNAFATEVFKNNPLVAIQHDGDLSRIEDNTKLNSIISHEEMTMNEKYKPSYTSRVNSFLFMGTNQPVKISDAKSGIIRRLIDVHPTGVRIAANHYNSLLTQIDFELGAIAYHCLQVYREMGKNYYNAYRPVEMMFQTDVFFNFIEAHFDLMKSQDGISLKQAYTLYKEYCMDTGIASNHIQPQYKVREELRNYFDEFKERETVGNEVLRSYYKGFNANKFKTPAKHDAATFSLVLDGHESLLDELFANQPAQQATKDGLPTQKWVNVKTTLSEIDTKEVHFVKVPSNHVVIDFDLTDDSGEKSLERNLEAASGWPATYAELSKSGSGVHLHYLYDGPGPLAKEFSPGIEIKQYTGDSALRRKVTACNSVPVAELHAGLPIKEKPVLSEKTMQSEKSLRAMIERNLRKEIHPGTKSSVDFIAKVLEDAYGSGMVYDVTDLRPAVVAFANNSTNQALQAIRVVQGMHFASEARESLPESIDDQRVTYFDVEVYPNLFVICWKFEGDANVVKMINPSPQDVEMLFKLKLVGFNNRRYDNHMLYARYMGYDNMALYKLSSKIINGQGNSGLFGEAYNLSYADIYEYSSEKKGLKKWEIELGLHHMELDIPWDQPVPEELWDKVVAYCVNDVLATEAVAENRRQDFVARQILAELSGLSVNHTTQNHTARIIFGTDKNPQQSFVYTDLSEQFPGYTYDLGKSTYRGEEVGEGGYVYAEPGIYQNVALLDVASMHPTSIEQLNAFGEYTPNFADLKAARMAIKRQDFKTASTMLDGRLAPFLGNPEEAEALAYALKIVINIVYGLTSAKFDNAFRDPRNKDNIVAKRGALFMIDLKNAVQEQGYIVAHIKTDSIKIPDADPYIIRFVTEFGQNYGYDFEHEATYEKMCLVNDAVYVAKSSGCDVGAPWECWKAVGAQFQHPIVYKSLFTKEPLSFEDYCETRSVQKGSMYLDYNWDTPMATHPGIPGMTFVGRTGMFVPVKKDGGALYRVHEGKTYAVTGTKGHVWVEAEIAKLRKMKDIDTHYSDKLVDEAIRTINKFGSFEEFVS